MNESLESYSPDYGYRFENLEHGVGNSDSLLVILTFSGGGTRAASFAYGVLEKLRDTRVTWEGEERRLLDEVDIVSSVSGGSLTAAYYGLFRERIFDDFADRVLYADIQGWLVHQVLGLRNWVKLASPFYGRTHLMADQFTDEFFDGKTFGDMLEAGRRPYIVINATDASLGMRFEFTQDQFDLLYSDLNQYPVGYAVAASAAFPGLLTPIALRNYPGKNDYTEPHWISEVLARGHPGDYDYDIAEGARSYRDPERRYVHLMDGGVSDNLGVLPVIVALRQGFGDGVQSFELAPERIEKVVILSVNAKRKPSNDWDKSPNQLGLSKVLSTATSVPLDSFTAAEIEYLKLLIENLSEERRARKMTEDTFDSMGLRDELPDRGGRDIDIRFVEVAFNRLEDPEEVARINEVPTSFRLPREDVDLLRTAAGKILDSHPDFRQLVQDLNP